MAITRQDGSIVEARLRALLSDDLGIAQFICEIGAGAFPYCPICFDGEADSREHVPPKPLGGIVMANTCSPCNNKLGSRTESALQDWFDDAVYTFYSQDGDPRPFGHSRVLNLQTPDGEWFQVQERPSNPENRLGSALVEGGVTMHLALPARAQYKTGLLKNAFLAACLHVGGVPMTASTAEIRAELVATRDARSRRDVQLGPRAEAIRAYRTGQPANGKPLALMRTDGVDKPRFLISLAGTILVEWPFPDVDPLRDRRGGPIPEPVAPMPALTPEEFA
nr:HNH endonuclease [Jiangella mangrovi]